MDRRDYDLIERVLILIGRRADAKARWHRRNPHRSNPRARLAFTALEQTFHPAELVVFPSRLQMEAAGFRANGTHPVHNHMRGWYPGRGQVEVLGRSLARVTVFCCGEGSFLDQSDRGLLQSRQMVYGPAAIWLEF